MFNLFKNKELSLGQLGEKAAVTFIKRHGYKIICTNFTNTAGRRLGEIDIIAKEGAELVFVEVKTRKKTNFITLPEENITRQKLHKLKKIAAFYLSTNQLWDSTFRFDALAIIYHSETNLFKINHLKNIFIDN